MPELIDCLCGLAEIFVEHVVILLELPVVLWQRSFPRFFGRKLLFARPKKGGIVVAKANEFCAPGGRVGGNPRLSRSNRCGWVAD